MYYIFHKGTTPKAPENSISGIESVIAAKGNWIEIDCLLTKDDQVVLMHDETLDRTTNGEGNLSDFTLEEIEKLDAGSWFDKKFSGERIPLLADVLEICKKNKIRISIELKGENPKLSYLAQNLVEEKGVKDLSTFYSFSQMMLNELNQKHNIHLNIEENLDKNFDYAFEKGWGINPEVGTFTKAHVERAKKKNLSMHVWTVNDEKEKDMLFLWGVDAIITDELLP